MSKESRLIKSITPKLTPIGSELILPNTSGDHVRSIKRAAPVGDKDLVNKEYVDSKFPVTHVSTTGRTTDDHHSEAHNIAFHSDTTATGAELNTLTDNSMADALHRHSELSASDGSPDKIVYTDSDGVLFVDATGTGLDVLHSATIGNHLIVGDDLTVDTNTLFVDSTTKRVGIGTAAVDSKLHIENAGTFEVKLQNTANSAMNIGFYGASVNVGNIENVIVSGKWALKLGTFDDIDALIIRDGKVGVGVASPTLPLDIKAKSGHTAIGGFAIKLTNKTGSNTVAGQLVNVYIATAIDDAFKTISASDENIIGVVLDAGVADGSEAWVVVNGIADVLMDAGGSARGDRIISSATAGSGDVWNVGGAVATHFQEIGHCIETRGGAGLARCILHFN